MIEVENVSSFIMSSHDSNVTIVCNNYSARFEFNNMSVLHINGLTFIGCDGNKFISISQFILEDSQFIGDKDVTGAALELKETSATFIRTEFNRNYGSNVIFLICETNVLALSDFILNENYNEDIGVSARAGGAILSNHSNVTIVDSVFEGNSAQAGGAIFAELQSNITIINSTFVRNQANSLQSHQFCYTGGGVLYSDSGSSVLVHNSTFENNTAHWFGGVMTTGLHSKATITITNSYFISNAAYYFGGVLSNRGDYSSITISNSKFTNNSAKYDGTYAYHGAGGVLSLHNAHHSSITISDSEFIDNSAFYLGGVLYLLETYNSSITITDSEFIDNSANHDGGVLHLLNANNSRITITDSEFIGNSANCVSGVLYLSDANNSRITITNSEFTINSANYYGTYYGRHSGGVLSLYNAEILSITITDSEFTNNSGNHHGGVLSLYKASHSSITITDSEFTYNSATYSDGGVLSLRLGYNPRITITDSEFIGNSAFYGGGVLDLLDVYNSSITITDSEFIGNSANYDGGVLRLSDAYNSSITITDSEFTNNSVRHGRGGVLLFGNFFIYGSISTIIISSCNITNNSASSGGVVFSTNIPSIAIIACMFVNNKAHGFGGYSEGKGGTMYVDNSEVTINSSEFYHNTAKYGGVLFAKQSTAMIIGAHLSHNRADNNGGVLKTIGTNVIIIQCTFKDNKAVNDGGTTYIQRGDFNTNFSKFDHNTANRGGVLWAQQANINVRDTSLSNNMAYTDGGVLFAEESTGIIMFGANFSHNRADNNGGTMYTQSDKAVTSIISCKFDHNTAGNDGGVIQSYQGTVNISESEYSNNSANNEGGVFHIDQTNLRVSLTSFTDSKANGGGVIWSDQGVLIISQSTFANSNASAGGVIWAEQTTIIADIVHISCNYANFGVVYLLESNTDWLGIQYSNNVGSLYALGGTVTVRNESNLTNNTQPNCTYTHQQTKEGGAITVFHGEIKFYGNSLLTYSKADRGGALKAIGHSKVHIFGNVTIANNTGNEAGGGIYLGNSELTCWKGSSLKIDNNSAKEKGGGISATGSLIEINNPLVNQKFSSLLFHSNQAIKGGGLFLKMDSKIYIIKSKIMNILEPVSAYHITFSLNSAQYGGAIYVSDNGMCTVSTDSTVTVSECFAQSLAMYAPMITDFDPDDTRCQNIDFVNNTAKLSGNSLFGGLLDRCSVSQFAETNINNVNMDYTFSNGTMIVKGYEYFQKISNIQDTDISSPPVRVCFCSGGQPNCSHQYDPIQVRRGQQRNITLSLAIVNQIHDPLQEATILSHFRSGNYICQNHIQNMDGSCSNVNFAVSSNNDTEELILSLDEGPCKDAPESKARVTLEFYCPQCLIGFELDESEEGCRCVCDSQLFPYFTNCSGQTLIRERNVWITSVITNHTSNTHQYLIHPYCPFDYCHPPSSRVEINLNIPNGADAQCANHRTGLLCGTCQRNFSLSLSSSHCLPCSTHWYAVLIALLIAAILAGIVLVALLLTLNLTVAIGTLNGIIFYANIVYANNTLLLPFTESFNFITVFISWLNLEIGFDTCFFVGMDAYSKTPLQFAFPGYVFFLVFMVIIISKHSMRFSQLIGKRNPVATLTTLISLSYAKFLHITIASLSFAILEYSDGSRTYVWLVDARIGYLSGKHVALFIIALLVIIAGVCFTALLLFWQWLLRHQDKILFRWTKCQKLCHFIEPYYAPYVDKHRYWAGLLLLVRVVLYIVFALNVNGDPHVSLVAVILTIGGLLLTKGFLVKVYKKWPIDVMESIMYFNILGFATLTWYFIGSPQRQTAVAYTSVTITFLFLLMVIAFHVYKFTPLGSVLQNAKVFKVLAGKLVTNKKAEEVIDQDLKEPEHKEQEVSFSVVEVPKPILERPEPEVHIQLRSQELPCCTPAISLETQESEMKDCNNK